MRIVCPNCDTAYDAPAAVVSAGRSMRCAKCRSEWMPLAPAEGAVAQEAMPHLEPEPSPQPEFHDAPAAGQPEEGLVPEPVPRSPIPVHAPLPAAEPVIRAPFPQIQPVPRKRHPAVVAGWVASVLVLVIAFWLAIAFRQTVMQHWPASERAYAALGLI
jgi:predicted Zn finger-like uncharacterized protein